MAASRSDDDVVIIKKYANRRLYDTESSAYITLERLAQMVRQKRDFKVVDAKSGDDITRSVLAQIIMEEEARGATMLPVNFLRQLISLYGDSMQSVVPDYLEASLEALQRNQNQFREAMAGAFATNPFAEMARRNMEMFTAAAATGRGSPAGEPPVTGEPAADTKSELAALKSQLQELQKKLDKLG
ncbi:polyhydroxyalkanoate synthesis repressor PhaR [Sphingosinicella terrae]|jgi:polyhydroxyalkanoate synthesis repressor PhaR|uniref:polyhydroxyalkanoate synthesis repressor PhaR n=1 Tax=Sphingosinicella terrae TaxID=2172047 RepID=UPI000E0DCB4C|nr:polyhydroxyalkanoate synthesis repressor PhaR [Sphingosinicella terrae]